MTAPINASDWDHETPHAQQAAKALYLLGVAAAADQIRISYTAAGRYLKTAGKGYGGRSLPLDALAALCALLETPDLSAVFWSVETIAEVDPTSSRPLPRWNSVADKMEDEDACHAFGSWPAPDAT